VGKQSAQHANIDASPVALVTGAGRRVGNQLARGLAQHGYRLALHANRSAAGSRELVDELAADGIEAIALTADLRDERAISQMIEQAHSHFGRIDALINNAAIWNRKALEATTAQDVREHFEINALATFLCCRDVGLRMIQQPQGGAIVNIGDWAVQRPYRDYAAYFVSKGSIPTITRDMAVELAMRNPNVRVNAILPGPIMLPEEMTEAERRTVIDATLVKRAGTPQDMLQAVLFLLTNTFVTGVCLPVDGGRSIFAPAAE